MKQPTAQHWILTPETLQFSPLSTTTPQQAFGGFSIHGYTVFSTLAWPAVMQRNASLTHHLTQHIQRLYRDAHHVKLQPPLQEQTLITLISKHLTPYLEPYIKPSFESGLIRLSLTPTQQAFSALSNPALTPMSSTLHLELTPQNKPKPNNTKDTQGVLDVSNVSLWPNVQLKTVCHHRAFPTLKLAGSFAEATLLKQHAMAKQHRDTKNEIKSDAKYDDTLWVRYWHNTGEHLPAPTPLTASFRPYITESTTSNIFFIKHTNNKTDEDTNENTLALYTPHPENDGCLPGITRQHIINTAHQQRTPYAITVHEGRVFLDELSHFDGAFLTNAGQGIRKIAAIDHREFPWSTPTIQRLDMLQRML